MRVLKWGGGIRLRGELRNGCGEMGRFLIYGDLKSSGARNDGYWEVVDSEYRCKVSSKLKGTAGTTVCTAAK